MLTSSHLVVEDHRRDGKERTEAEHDGNNPHHPEVEVHAHAHGTDLLDAGAEVIPHSVVPDHPLWSGLWRRWVGAQPKSDQTTATHGIER